MLEVTITSDHTKGRCFCIKTHQFTHEPNLCSMIMRSYLLNRKTFYTKTLLQFDFVYKDGTNGEGLCCYVVVNVNVKGF